VRFPRQVQDILRAALAVRDRREEATISRTGSRSPRGRLQRGWNRLLAGRFTHAWQSEASQAFAAQSERLFVFLERDDLEATNWPAEHADSTRCRKPQVVRRKPHLPAEPRRKLS